MTEPRQIGLIAELKRRNVFRVAAAFVAVAWLVLQLLDVLNDILALPEWFGRVVLITLLVAFPIALILAWAFELTPDGVKRDSEVDHSQSVMNQSGRKLDFVIIGVLATALTISLYANFSSRNAPIKSIESALNDTVSIAVLPFANRSAQEDDVYFVDGIHDDILTQLARIHSLTVTSRTSVERYRDPAAYGGVREIATDLGVRNILEGGVQRSGDRIRINVQLIDVSEDRHLWAQTYDRELTAANIFAVQGEIATSVADALRVVLAADEKQALGETPTENLAAYDLNSLGRHHLRVRTEESLQLAKRYFEQAIEEDPEYGPALAGLADSYMLLVQHGNLDGAIAFPLAAEAIDKAMAIDDSVSEVWASLGVSLGAQSDWDGAEQAFRRALALDEKNANAWHRLGQVLIRSRRFDEGLLALENAYALEPMSGEINGLLAERYYQKGDFVRARHFYERMPTIDESQSVLSRIRVADMYFDEGDIARAITLWRDVLDDSPGNQEVLQSLAFGYVVLGDISEARRWFLRSESIDRTSRSMYLAFLAEKNYDGSIVYLEDKLELDQNRRSGLTLHSLFQASYLGGDISLAADYIQELLTILNGRFEVNPANTVHLNNLLQANFLIDYGEEFGLDSGRGHEMVDEILDALLTLREQGMNRPLTLVSLAQAYALKGNYPAALASLDEAVERGYRNFFGSIDEPAFDKLRNSSDFIAITERMERLLDQERSLLAAVEFEPYSLPEARQPIAMSREQFRKFEGYYSDGNVVAHIYIASDGSYIARAGQSTPFPILPFEENKFFGELDSDFVAEFMADENGEITHVMAGDEDNTQRFKRVMAPLPAVELDRAILKRYEGTYVHERLSPATESRSETDLWAAVISVDDDDKIWIDFDNQPILEIVPTSETEFNMPGFLWTVTMIVDADIGITSQFEMIADGRLMLFERQ